jgi:hypothetical protein
MQREVDKYIIEKMTIRVIILNKMNTNSKLNKSLSRKTTFQGTFKIFVLLHVFNVIFMVHEE